MVSGAGEDASHAPPRVRNRRLAITLSAAFGLLIIAFTATVLVLNATVFSASGFVASYLGSLERHDLAEVLAMPGVEAPGDASEALLRRDALGSLGDARLINDDDEGAGVHRVTYEYSLGDDTTGGDTTGRTTFVVEHTGPRMGVFSAWRFVQSPLSVLEVMPHNAVEFDVNGVAVIAENGAGQPSSFQVLVPGAYTIGHESTYLEAEPTTVTLLSTSGPEQFELDVQASAEFVDAVGDELAAYLDECATQQVLLPTGCPFGKSISNRIDSLPRWSIVNYPAVSIEPGEQTATWVMPAAAGSAHLSVDVRSLFDGTVSTLDEDVTFTVAYLITLPGDGSITLTPLG